METKGKREREREKEREIERKRRGGIMPGNRETNADVVFGWPQMKEGSERPPSLRDRADKLRNDARETLPTSGMCLLRAAAAFN